MAAALWIMGRWVDGDWHRPPAGVLAVGGLAVTVVAMQVVSLPAELLRWIAPRQAELLPLWGYGDGPPWSRLSLAPDQTRRALAMLIAYLLLFAMGYHLFGTRRQLQRLLRAVAYTGVALAALGLLQFLDGTDRYLWVYAHPSRQAKLSVTGPLTNANHFAHLMALAIGPLALDLRRAVHRPDAGGRLPPAAAWAIPAGGLSVVILAAVLTYSRGGLAVVGMSLAGALWILGQPRREETGPRTSATWPFLTSSRLFILGAVAIALAGITFHGWERLAGKLTTRQLSLLDQIDPSGGRRLIWSAALGAWSDFKFLGTGAGTHRFVHPAYMAGSAEVFFTHAESGYLQILMETGLAGAVLLTVALALSAGWCWRGLAQSDVRAMAGAVAVMWCVSVVHSIFDFIWYIPACMLWMLLPLAAMARLVAGERTGDAPTPDYAPGQPLALRLVSVGAVMGILVWMGTSRLPDARAAGDWDDYLALSLAGQNFEAGVTGPGRQARFGQVDPRSARTLDAQLSHLGRVLARDPQDAAAHLRMAACLLQKFDLQQQQAANCLNVVQLRQAVRDAGFKNDRQEKAWLSRLLGPNLEILQRARRHALMAVHLCPLQGRGYIYLLQLDFLNSHSPHYARRLLEQSLAVGKYDGLIRLAAGHETLLAGQPDAALAHWQAAYKIDDATRRHMLENLGSAFPGEFFAQALQPGERGLEQAYYFFKQRHDDQRAKAVAVHFARYLETQTKQVTGPQRAARFHQLQAVHHFLGNHQQALRAAQQAVACSSSDYQYRYVLALRLLDAGRGGEAIEHIRWCMRRRPEQKQWRQLLRRATL
jgi:O-antigen ligase